DWRAFVLVSGEGLPSKITLVLPEGFSARVDRSSWELPAVFTLLSRLGAVARSDMEQALNMGVGMVALVDADDASAVVRALDDLGIDGWVAGEVGVAGDFGGPGSVTLAGNYG